MRVALVGEYDSTVVAHRAIERSFALAFAELGLAVEPTWLPTDAVRDANHLEAWDGFWCVPASPYRSLDGALAAIRYAREQGRPFLGTCGGFQHALLEYARHVLGWLDAGHAEMSATDGRTIITPLSCALLDVAGRVDLAPGSELAHAFGTLGITEEYHCGYSLNPEHSAELLAGALRAVAWDEAGHCRAVQLAGHPFFVATLFQPERSALHGRLSPLVRSFFTAVASTATFRS